jgi:hypothetical protein
VIKFAIKTINRRDITEILLKVALNTIIHSFSRLHKKAEIIKNAG